MSILVVLLLQLTSLATPQGGAEENYGQALARGEAAGRGGRPAEAVAAFTRCLELRPKDPITAYNLAWACLLEGATDDSLRWLEKSLEWGYFKTVVDLNWALGDYDFEPLRGDPRYQEFLERARQLPSVAESPLPPAYIDWSGGHRAAAFVARFSPDGSRILTSCRDGCARIWDSTSGELLVLLVGHRGQVVSCAWADAGRQVLTGGQDGTFRFWNARTGDSIRMLYAPGQEVPGTLSPDCRFILSPLRSGARVIDARTGQQRHIASGQVYAVAFSPDSERFSTGCADGTTALFDVLSHERLAAQGSSTPIFDVTFSPDGRWLVTAGADGLVRWLDARSLELARSWRAHAAEVNDVSFSSDGAKLLTCSVDHTARIWRAEDGALLHTLSGHGDEVFYGAWSPDGARVLTPSRDGTVGEWDASTGELMLTLGGLGSMQRNVVFSPDGTRLVALDRGGPRSWDMSNGAELAWPGGRTRVQIRKGHGGAPAAMDAHEVAWNGKSEQIEIDGARIETDAVFLSPDRGVVYTVDEDERGRLWDARSGHFMGDLGPLSRDGDLAQYGSRWASACFSPDGALLATAHHADGSVHVWEASTGEEVVVLRDNGYRLCWAVAFDPSGGQLAVSRSSSGMGSPVEIWSATSFERLQLFSGHSGFVTHLTFRSDGRAVASGDTLGVIRLWDLETGTCSRVLQVPLVDWARCLGFSTDGKRLAAATNDHRLLVWDIESGKVLGTIVPGDEPGDWLAFAPSAHYHGTPASIARTRLVQGAISYPLSCFAAELESPEQVRDSFAGLEVPLPKLPAPPSLVVARPIERTSITTERVAHVEALATEPLAGLARIEVVQDGLSVPADVLARALTLQNSERLARLDLRLPFPAGAVETKITLQAVSTHGIKSRPESFVVRYEPPKHELYVLALGVADYADNALDLAYPVQDVDGLLQRLQAQNGELFHAVHVERRVDREVTNAEALRLREEFLLQAKPDDTIVVFVAGHGIRTDTGEYWFLTTDATPAKPFGGIQRSTLELLVTWDKLHATKRVLLLDTCHSGAAFGKGARGERGIAFQQSEVDTLLERSSGLYILAATSDDGFAREQEGNGLFTRALLDGLEGAADAGDFGDKDGTVGIDELMHFARYAVLERSAGRQRPTFPKIEGGENFPLARVAR